MLRSNDAHTRGTHGPRVSMTAHSRTPTTDIRKRMDDVHNEMEQASRGGRLRLPLKFVNFHQTDVMYQFTRAAVGYALSYVKVKTLETEHAERAATEELAKLHASQLQNQFQHDAHDAHDAPAQEDLRRQQQRDERVAWLQRLRAAIEAQEQCATQLAETYARLVLHCSNFEHHKEDERFFECVYYFVCAVAKIGLAPDHWLAVENELGFLFRGAQFSATIQLHTSAKTQREQAAAAAASEASSGASTAAKKIQNLTAAGAAVKDAPRGDGALFVLPEVPTTKCCFFPASLPVGKIVSELDAAKLRATRNIEVSQSIRDRIRAKRDDEFRRRHQLGALVSPRVGVRLDYLKSLGASDDETRLDTSPATRTELSAGTMPGGASSSLVVASSISITPQKPRRRAHAGIGSPRLSMKATFTSRSPTVNHLLPGTEDRVRLALEDYERNFQQKLVENRQRLHHGQQQQRRSLGASPTCSDLSSSASTVSTLPTPTKPPPVR